MNPWAWSDRNPYYGTAFHELDLAPDTQRATVRKRIEARRTRIRRSAARFPVFGRVLTVAEINSAAQRLDSASERLSDELRTHRPEPPVDAPEELSILRELSEFSSTALEYGTELVDYRVLPKLLPPMDSFPMLDENDEELS
ncbi:hypothetical protein LTV02_07830 [Nocardia yamanashiensis]|uniref:hypothetical protein n=1 Tax=Nocardia yamanashiensis TaxID=209247 RepID=UPI001E3F3CD3|nr:hypothetical protein [Nocardia yamanashiensis]UGT43286.1 hypothetical protein LTV02_07830 [Nocardia yamanashiensis]